MERKARDLKKDFWVSYGQHVKNTKAECEALMSSTVKRRFVRTVCETSLGRRIVV